MLKMSNLFTLLDQPHKTLIIRLFLKIMVFQYLKGILHVGSPYIFSVLRPSIFYPLI